MAHDGSYEVAWKGHAFPYLMHHPNAFHKTENYGTARAEAAGHGHGRAAPSAARDSESEFEAKSGTWNGPAPAGSAADRAAFAAGQRGAPTNVIAAVPASESATVRLTGGGAMPAVCLGTSGFESPDAVRMALEVGYRGFDCGEVYRNEEVVGEGIREFVASGKRDELFLLSKVWNNHHRPEDVRAACERSLKALGVSCLDLYLVHWPCAWDSSEPMGAAAPAKLDTGVTLEQTWAAMEALVDAGLVKSIGVSNFGLAQIEQILASCRIRPSVNQVELHVLNAQRKLVGVLFRKGIVSQAYSPLGSSGQCDGATAASLLSNPPVVKIAEACGKSPAQVLLKWNMQRGVPVVSKASSEAHMRANLEGMTTWKLSNQAKVELDTLECAKRFVNFDWHTWPSAEEGGITKPSTVRDTL